MTRDELAERHWAAVSNLTQLADPGPHWAARVHRVRVRFGQALVRAGLAIAPTGDQDIPEICLQHR